MKKNLVLAAMVCSTILTGCSQEEYVAIDHQPDFTTTSERLLYSTTKKLKTCSNLPNTSMYSLYLQFFDSLKTRRETKTNMDASYPFCDSIFQLQIAEYSVPDECKLSNTYKNITGLSLYSVCKIRNNDKSDLPQDPPAQVQISNTITPEMYDQIISAVKTCKRTANSVMDRIKPNADISADDLIAVKQMLIECKKYQLENAVQGN